MPEITSAPHSPTLVPPRKSVELEDPGAHELDSSGAEEDVFADAQEDRHSHSGPSSPIPTTRVEKVDDRENHGEVPGTEAYKMRMQDAVPDEIEVVPEGQRRPRDNSQDSRSHSPGTDGIPTTIVEKVDPSSPSHGEVPGTAAFARRMADAVPDVITSTSPHSENEAQSHSSESKAPNIPRTVVTRVDSTPAHGEVPGTEAFDMRLEDAKPDVVEKKSDEHSESRLTKLPQPQHTLGGFSPIAADGGFGPMGSDSEGEAETDAGESQFGEDSENKDGMDDFGDDFDDFEAGVDNDEFGEFDDMPEKPSMTKTASPELEHQLRSAQPIPLPDIPFPLLDFGELDTLEDIQEAVHPYLESILPHSMDVSTEATPPAVKSNSVFLTERSHSLWSQLVAPPPLQPPNWVRSRIRRLFLVSLGVPIDLDEILPASKQKKLILPSLQSRSDSPAPSGSGRAGSRVRLKHENASSASVDKSGAPTKSKRRKGPPPAPEMDLEGTKMLCGTTEAALSNMTDAELESHHKKIIELNTKASEVLEFWLKRRDGAREQSLVLEEVIENLVKHARRVRK